MKLYAICWQDSCEPWGWAPIDPEWDTVAGGDRQAKPFHWNHGDAVEELELVRQHAIQEYVKNGLGRGMTLGEINDSIGGQFSIQEYDVPEPPR